MILSVVILSIVALPSNSVTIDLRGISKNKRHHVRVLLTVKKVRLTPDGFAKQPNGEFLPVIDGHIVWARGFLPRPKIENEDYKLNNPLVEMAVVSNNKEFSLKGAFRYVCNLPLTREHFRLEVQNSGHFEIGFAWGGNWGPGLSYDGRYVTFHVYGETGLISSQQLGALRRKRA